MVQLHRVKTGTQNAKTSKTSTSDSLLQGWEHSSLLGAKARQFCAAPNYSHIISPNPAHPTPRCLHY